VLCDGECLRAGDFPQIASQLGVQVEPPALDHASSLSGTAPDARDVHRILPDVPSSTVDQLVASGVKLTGIDGHLRKLEEIEHELIRFAIDKYEGHMSEVARRLGIGRSTLYRKLREMGIDDNEQAGAA
jgi:DNA-binding NtrC family response regulator